MKLPPQIYVELFRTPEGEPQVHLRNLPALTEPLSVAQCRELGQLFASAAALSEQSVTTLFNASEVRLFPMGSLQ